MSLKTISLIVAILASIGTLVVSQMQVAGKITEQKNTLDQTTNERNASREAETKAKKEAQLANAEAKKLAKELGDTKDSLAQVTSRANTQEERANRNEADLSDTRSKLTDAQRDVAAWQALGIPVEQVRTRLAELIKAKTAMAALDDEKKVLIRQVNYVKERLAIYEDKNTVPDLPPGLKGKVVAVDPKWDFVVLDIGGNQGVVPRGQLLVNRDGKLVAKLRVVSVDADRSIANVMPEWSQGQVMAGDTVFH
jgi:flagellar biosynthesis GTPase FlhF